MWLWYLTGHYLESTIPGAPGQDYPTFSSAPQTSFDCAGLVQGYYADQETDCQAYHVCGSSPASTAPISTLLCPNGTKAARKIKWEVSLNKMYNRNSLQSAVLRLWLVVQCGLQCGKISVSNLQEIPLIQSSFSRLPTSTESTKTLRSLLRRPMSFAEAETSNLTDKMDGDILFKTYLQFVDCSG